MGSIVDMMGTYVDDYICSGSSKFEKDTEITSKKIETGHLTMTQFQFIQLLYLYYPTYVYEKYHAISTFILNRSFL